MTTEAVVVTISIFPFQRGWCRGCCSTGARWSASPPPSSSARSCSPSTRPRRGNDGDIGDNGDNDDDNDEVRLRDPGDGGVLGDGVPPPPRHRAPPHRPLPPPQDHVHRRRLHHILQRVKHDVYRYIIIFTYITFLFHTFTPRLNIDIFLAAKAAQ